MNRRKKSTNTHTQTYKHEQQQQEQQQPSDDQAMRRDTKRNCDSIFYRAHTHLRWFPLVVCRPSAALADAAVFRPPHPSSSAYFGHVSFICARVASALLSRIRTCTNTNTILCRAAYIFVYRISKVTRAQCAGAQHKRVT